MVYLQVLFMLSVMPSSLNANAESSVARGMMQLTEAAWLDATDLHYRQAFEWETNVEVGILCLAKLKGDSERNNVFSYPRLAASYRYGYGALRKEKFMVSRMKTPVNRIYRKLFAGDLSPIIPPKNKFQKMEFNPKLNKLREVKLK